MDVQTRWKRTKDRGLLSADGAFLPITPPREDLRLEISASPDAWRALYIMSFARPGDIVSIIRNFSKAAYDHFSAEPGRGIDRSSEKFVEKVKRYAAYVYCWAHYWLKKPQDEWPEPLKDIVKKVGKYAYHGSKERPEPQRVTAYIMERDFGRKRGKYHLKKWTRDPEAFGRTFILDNKYARFVKTICKN